MNYIGFGNTGEIVSEMCLGTMMFGDRCDEVETARIVDLAIDQGVTFIDTAAMYCEGYTEEIMGRVLKGKRDKVFITTKVVKGIDPQSIRESIDESLSRLQMDYVDLYLIHWPKVGMHPEAIMEALNYVIQQGKARYAGCSNYPAWVLELSNAIAEKHGWPKLINNQIPYNLIERGAEVEILPQAMTEGIAITTYRTLVLGLLTGKYKPDEPLPENTRSQVDQRIPAWLEKYGDSIRRFHEFAARRGIHPAQLAIAWVRHSPAVTCPLVGVSSTRQLQATIDAFSIDLTDTEYTEVMNIFDTAVKEEAGGNFPALRRELHLVPHQDSLPASPECG